MEIRLAQPSDFPGIIKVHLNGFGEEGLVISDLVQSLIADNTADPLVSLVAEFSKSVIANIIFSRVHIDGPDDFDSYLLAPLAVDPNFQRKGIGSKLVKHGLQSLQESGTELVFVLGDPEYYQKFGFKTGHHVHAPFELSYPEAWMCLSLGAVAPEDVTGQLICADSLNRSELW